MKYGDRSPVVLWLACGLLSGCAAVGTPASDGGLADAARDEGVSRDAGLDVGSDAGDDPCAHLANGAACGDPASGPQVCFNGVCQRCGNGVVDDGEVCDRLVPVEFACSASCVECLVPSDCMPLGAAPTCRVPTCVAGACAWQAAEPGMACTLSGSRTGVCDATSRCLVCLDDEDCPVGLHCDGGDPPSCVECNVDADCRRVASDACDLSVCTRHSCSPRTRDCGHCLEGCDPALGCLRPDGHPAVRNDGDGDGSPSPVPARCGISEEDCGTGDPTIRPSRVFTVDMAPPGAFDGFTPLGFAPGEEVTGNFLDDNCDGVLDYCGICPDSGDNYSPRLPTDCCGAMLPHGACSAGAPVAAPDNSCCTVPGSCV